MRARIGMLLLAGGLGLAAPALTPSQAEAQPYWDRPYGPRYGYAPPRPYYYRPPPAYYYRPVPPPYYYRPPPPPVYYAPPPAYYGPPGVGFGVYLR